MDKNDAINIIEIIYSRIMQLHFSWKFAGTMVDSPIVRDEYPDLVWSLKSSFATDAYATVSGLLSTGNYSFGRLGQDCPNIKKQVDDAEHCIDAEISNFRYIRNQMFCHAVKKKSFGTIDNMYNKFDSIFHILTELHAFCCKELGIEDSDYHHYSVDAFNCLQKEINEFSDLLLRGCLELKRCETMQKS